MFWPRTIWGCYGRSLDDFKLPENRAAALRCLNHMVGGGGQGQGQGVCGLNHMVGGPGAGG